MHTRNRLVNTELVNRHNKFMSFPSYILIMLMLLFSACQPDTQPRINEQETEQKILTLTDRQQEAWNRGDIDAFMEGYLRSDSLRFASGDQVRYGWETLRKRYKNTYPDTQAMGTLQFSERELDVLSDRHALLFGRWQLFRSRDTLSGRYTLLFHKTGDGWRIVHDHTSSR